MDVWCITSRRCIRFQAVSLTLLLGVSVLSTLLDNTVQAGNDDDIQWAKTRSLTDISFPPSELAYFPLKNTGTFKSFFHARCIPSTTMQDNFLLTGIIVPGTVRWVEFSVAPYFDNAVENPRNLVTCTSYSGSKKAMPVRDQLSADGIPFLHVIFLFALLPASFTLSEDDPTFEDELLKVRSGITRRINGMHFLCTVKEYPEEDVPQAISYSDASKQKFGIPPSRRDAWTKAAGGTAESTGQRSDGKTKKSEESNAKKLDGGTDETHVLNQQHSQTPASKGGDATDEKDILLRRIDELQEQLDEQGAAAALFAASQQRKTRTGVAVGVVFGLLLLLALGGIVVHLFLQRRRDVSARITSDPLLQADYTDAGHTDTVQP